MADHEKLRRIRAEDLEWSLAVVPLLTQLCLEHIVQNFEGNLFFPYNIKDSLSCFGALLDSSLMFAPGMIIPWLYVMVCQS